MISMFFINSHYCFNRKNYNGRIVCKEILEDCCEERCPHSIEKTTEFAVLRQQELENLNFKGQTNE